MLQCLINYTFRILSFHALSQTCFSTKSNSLRWLVSQGPWNHNCCHFASANPVVLSQAMRECSLCTYGSSFRYLSISVTQLNMYIKILDAVRGDSPAEKERSWKTEIWSHHRTQKATNNVSQRNTEKDNRKRHSISSTITSTTMPNQHSQCGNNGAHNARTRCAHRMLA